MSVSARAEYACLAMVELAARFGEKKPVRLTDVTDKHGIPKRFVVLILLQMKAAGLVRTVRGPTGGYTLAKAPDQISLHDIFSALERVEGPADRPRHGSQLGPRLRAVWARLAESRAKVLRDVSLADLVPQSSDDYMI